MRTKTLLLTAALAAAGIASSKAQVYSVNAVGYVNTTLVPGFNLISNPLDNKAGNKIGDLFKNITPSIPNATTVYAYVSGNFALAIYDDIDQAFNGAGAALSLNPGNGVFVRNPSSQNLTVTFVGEVPQGPLKNPIPQGFSIKASQVPQSGKASDPVMGPLVGHQGDTVYEWDKAGQKYVVHQYDDIDQAWGNGGLKTLDVGEAFFLFSKNSGTWDRTFSVN